MAHFVSRADLRRLAVCADLIHPLIEPQGESPRRDQRPTGRWLRGVDGALTWLWTAS